FNALLNSIKGGSFQGDAIELSNKGLTDSDVKFLMQAINDKPEIAARLKYINFSENSLTTAPDLYNCVALEMLVLEKNQLTTAHDVSMCVALRGLFLNNNQLTTAGKVALNALQAKLPNMIVESGAPPLTTTLTKEIIDEHFEILKKNFETQFN